jgi:hypothetical protein
MADVAPFVMPGRVPSIHDLQCFTTSVDGRDEPGNDAAGTGAI